MSNCVEVSRATAYSQRQDLDASHFVVYIRGQASTQRKLKEKIRLSGALQSCRAIIRPRMRVTWHRRFRLAAPGKKIAVYRSYEILEVMPNGSSVKRTVVFGLEFAKVTLEALSRRTSNECMAADERTHQIVAQLNLPPAKQKMKRIFQIAYDEEASLRRSELLRSHGFGVISVLSSEAAKVLLSSIQKYDLFIVGHSASELCRSEMVDWLKTHYPDVEVLALNPPHQPLPNADYNALESDVDGWLLFVTDHFPRVAYAR